MPDWQALEKKYFMNTFKRMPLTLDQGQRHALERLHEVFPL